MRISKKSNNKEWTRLDKIVFNLTMTMAIKLIAISLSK